MTLKLGIPKYHSYINKNYVRSDGSTLVTGSIDMNGNTLTNVSDPVNPQDVASKQNVDTANRLIIILLQYKRVIQVLYVKVNINFLLEEPKLKIQLQGF